MTDKRGRARMKDSELLPDHFDPVVRPPHPVSACVMPYPFENVFCVTVQNNKPPDFHLPVNVLCLVFMSWQTVKNQNIAPAKTFPSQEGINHLFSYREMLVFQKKPLFKHIPDEGLLTAIESFRREFLPGNAP